MSQMSEEFSLEKKLEELRQLLKRMQHSELDFDEQLRMFSEGKQLITACRAFLDQSELKVQKLVAGQTEAASFDD